MRYSGDDKAQVSMEFLITTALVLVVFTVSGLLINQKFVESTDVKVDIEGKSVVRRIAGNINAVSKAGNGYSTQFTLRGTLYGGNDYNVTFYDNEAAVWVYSGNNIWMAPLITTKIDCNPPTCSLAGGIKVIHIGGGMTKLAVENINGTISLEKV